MVGLKSKMYHGVLCNFTILCCLLLAVYAVLMLYYIYVMVIYDSPRLTDIITYITKHKDEEITNLVYSA